MEIKLRYLFLIALSLFFSGYISFPDYPLVLATGIIIGSLSVVGSINCANHAVSESEEKK